MLLLALAIGLQKPPAALNIINPDRLKAHVKWLADDARGGRATPSPGGDASADYIAAQFKEMGAKPVGGSYFQDVPVQGKTARNVVGYIAGSATSTETVILSAHYDGLGTKTQDLPDKIFNGANDDASGVAGVIEAGRALARMKPTRGVLLIAFCAEELGLVGSRYYAANPLIPIKQTAAMVELEQIGRTDDKDGKRVGAIAITGYTFSDLPKSLGVSAARLGIRTETPPQGDVYFNASDNASLARKGVPAHTLCTAFEYPDYHGPADTWDKLDYLNMSRVTKAVALGVYDLARGPRPKWNEANPKAARYLAAQKASE